MRGEERGRDPKSWFVPWMSEILKNTDCRIDVTRWGGNTDVYQGRQTALHCYCQVCFHDTVFLIF